MRVADFFCGGGGFSEGFRQAGFELCFAVDKWEPAVMTYKANKPQCKVIKDDIIRISNLPDREFQKLVPDTEVIIGSPPCVAFSNSNKSGNGDKTLGIILLEAFFRIIARKKYKANSVLRYWVLENVPNIRHYIKNEYTAKDLAIEGNFVFSPLQGASGVYNAKYFGAPTNRKRFICGEFPEPIITHTNQATVTLGQVLNSLNLSGNPQQQIRDCNYPDLIMPAAQVSDHQYTCEVQAFEWKKAKRLKTDRGYMGKMSFPENLEVPARTVMATMSSSSRESMILPMGEDRFRLPTVREAASMMSFPIDYKFYGKSKGIKHTLVGNAVPPKLSYAIAKAIASDANEKIPNRYVPIQHNPEIPFFDLNGHVFPNKVEREKRLISKFKYHIPYLIINSYRVELTNYHSNFETHEFIWDMEIHYGQGKKRAAIYTPDITAELIHPHLLSLINALVYGTRLPKDFADFQRAYCMTQQQRTDRRIIGPFELLELVKKFIHHYLSDEEQRKSIKILEKPYALPQAILVGAYVIKLLLQKIEGV